MKRVFSILICAVLLASLLALTVILYTDGACSGNPGPGGWGTLTNIGIMDSEVGGNVFAVMSLRNNATYSITYGDVIGFHAGDLTFSIN